MTTLVTPRFRHNGVLSDGIGIFGDKSDLSQKIFSLVVICINSHDHGLTNELVQIEATRDLV